ncbi:DUF433 domain-containing protein [Natronomonas marina]|jgi:uncharacterized protein (DUF433 family)|uniref:DUF433 domain-containing protein n=1 Tax=Natronomonas marina TaxID=2961939 RepID=UPI0020CA01CF|nr:DUF433 domain-containing protein [Natronomonas marina]
MAQSAVTITTELHDEPHIEGRRVTVRRIQGLVEEAGKPAEEVAERFDLDIASVYAALQYYHTHPDEMEAAERRRRERERRAREAGAKSVRELEADEDADGL